MSRWISDLLFPVKCISCNALTGNKTPICASCMRKLTAPTHKCRSCGELCDFCTCYEIKGINYRFIPFWYSGTELRRMLFKLKRSDDILLTRFFAAIMAENIRRRTNSVELGLPFQVITYVPRSKKAIRKYGTDQAKNIAEELAKQLGVECKSLIMRMSYTHHAQKELKYAGRLLNANDIYAPLPEAAKYRSILLVDDIITSGTTVSACCEILKVAGAKSVSVAAIAKTRFVK